MPWEDALYCFRERLPSSPASRRALPLHETGCGGGERLRALVCGTTAYAALFKRQTTHAIIASLLPPSLLSPSALYGRRDAEHFSSLLPYLYLSIPPPILFYYPAAWAPPMNLAVVKPKTFGSFWCCGKKAANAFTTLYGYLPRRRWRRVPADVSMTLYHGSALPRLRMTPPYTCLPLYALFANAADALC